MLQVQVDLDGATKYKLELEKDMLAKGAKHDHAQAALPNLAGAYNHWEKLLAELEEHIAALPGDALQASAYLAYAGFFESKLRAALRVIWKAQVGLGTA